MALERSPSVGVWSLVFEDYLKFGVWDLEFCRAVCRMDFAAPSATLPAMSEFKFSCHCPACVHGFPVRRE